jgi:hypothetical protein
VADGSAVLISSHILAEVAEGVVVIDHGRMLHEGPTADLTAEGSVVIVRSRDAVRLRRALEAGFEARSGTPRAATFIRALMAAARTHPVDPGARHRMRQRPAGRTRRPLAGLPQAQEPDTVPIPYWMNVLVVLLDPMDDGHRAGPYARRHPSRAVHPGSEPPDQDPGRRIAGPSRSEVPAMSS